MTSQTAWCYKWNETT